MANGCAARVETGKALPRADAGQVGQAHADAGEAFIVKACCNLHRLEALRFLQFLFDALDIFLLQVEQLGQCAQRFFAVLQTIGDDIDAKVGAVGGDGLADTIDKPAAPGWDKRQVDTVAFGSELVFLILSHRDVGHARRNNTAHHRLHAADE